MVNLKIKEPDYKALYESRQAKIDSLNKTISGLKARNTKLENENKRLEKDLRWADPERGKVIIKYNELVNKKKKAENNLFQLEGVRRAYLEYSYIKTNKPMLFIDWLRSDTPKKISLLLDETKFFNKMHRILFKESYAKNYKY
jgi:chromosome segregation ATPase